MLVHLLLPALVALQPGSAIPGAIEVHRGTFILKGLPGPEVIAAMKNAHVTHVIALCRDTEPGVDVNREAQRLSDQGISFARVVLDSAPSIADFELFRQLRNTIPKEARVLIHCTNGNRTAAVTVAWLVKEGRVKKQDAITLARSAGLTQGDTERAMCRYLGLPM